MRSHPRSLEAVLRDAPEVKKRLPWTEHAAAQLGRALQLIHGSDEVAQRARGYHGDIRLSNIFLEGDGRDSDPVFCLGGLAHEAQTTSSSPPIGRVPEFLRQKCESEDDLMKRQWHDIVALSWVLVQVLECSPRPMPDDHAEINGRWPTLDDYAKHRLRLPKVIDTLRQVFNPRTPSIEINAFLTTTGNGPTPHQTAKTPMARNELLTRLQGLSPPQFKEVLFLLKIPEHYLSGTGAPQADRAREAILYLEQRSQLERLARIFEEIDGPTAGP